MEESKALTLTDQVLNVPAEMIAAVAAGLEEPKDIALRFGFTQAQWTVLERYKPFLAEVARQREELDKNGSTFRSKTKRMAEDLGEDIYRIAKSDKASLPQKLDAFKTFAEMADMKPKQNQQASNGPAFSITINLGKKEKQVIDITPVIEEKK